MRSYRLVIIYLLHHVWQRSWVRSSWTRAYSCDRFFKESWKRSWKLSLGCDRVAICKTRGGWMMLLSFALWRSILPLPRCQACLEHLPTVNLSIWQVFFHLETSWRHFDLFDNFSSPILWRKKENLWKSPLFKCLSLASMPTLSWFIHSTRK